jgi:hypothetical protein
MLGDIGSALTAILLVIILTRYSPLRIFNAIKSGLWWCIENGPFRLFDWIEAKSQDQLQPKRTDVQKMFNTDLTWKQILNSTADLEHELYPREPYKWTHAVETCVHKDCLTPREVERLGLVWNSVHEKLEAMPEKRYSQGGIVNSKHDMPMASGKRGKADPMPGKKNKH